MGFLRNSLQRFGVCDGVFTVGRRLFCIGTAFSYSYLECSEELCCLALHILAYLVFGVPSKFKCFIILLLSAMRNRQVWGSFISTHQIRGEVIPNPCIMPFRGKGTSSWDREIIREVRAYLDAN